MIKYLLIWYVSYAVLTPHIVVSKNFADVTIDWHIVKKIRSVTDSLPKVFP